MTTNNLRITDDTIAQLRDEIMRRTAVALDDEAERLLFLSTDFVATNITLIEGEPKKPE